MAVILHDYYRSSASYRVRIALNLKCVEHERVAVNLLAGDQRGEANLAVNPQGFVPTLVVDGQPIAQSFAIIEYLDAVWPNPRLIPTDPLARARAIAQVMVIAADIHPIDNLRVLNRLTSQFGADQAARDSWYRHWISEGFTALEAMATGPGPFLGGDAPGIADVFLVPQMFNARRLQVPLDGFPRLVEADRIAAALPAFAGAHPDLFRP